jgi:hypothetical protein
LPIATHFGALEGPVRGAFILDQPTHVNGSASGGRTIMRNIVDENWQRLKRRLKDFWNSLIGEKRRPSF